MPELVLMGLGNRCRGDDAAGLRVVDGVEQRLAGEFRGRVVFFRNQGNWSSVLNGFRICSRVYLVDAICSTSGGEGRLLRWELGMEQAPQGIPSGHRSIPSSHGFDLLQIIEFARALEVLPAKLILYGLVGGQFGQNERVTPIVQAAIDETIDRVLNEIHTIMKSPSGRMEPRP